MDLTKLVERVPHRFCPHDPEHPKAVEANKVMPCLRCAFDAALAALNTLLAPEPKGGDASCRDTESRPSSTPGSTERSAVETSAEGQRKVIELACDEAERKGYQRGFDAGLERAAECADDWVKNPPPFKADNKTGALACAKSLAEAIRALKGKETP